MNGTSPFIRVNNKSCYYGMDLQKEQAQPLWVPFTSAWEELQNWNNLLKQTNQVLVILDPEVSILSWVNLNCGISSGQENKMYSTYILSKCLSFISATFD